MSECTQEQLCEKYNCLKDRVALLEESVYGIKESSYIFTANTGVPVNGEESSGLTSPRYFRDKQDYSIGASIINSYDPKGLFIVGGMDYDLYQTEFGGLTHFVYVQEAKILDGFASLFTQRKLWPVMGNFDYWPQQANTTLTPAVTDRTILRMFDYIPFAKRYYSVYDDVSDTEFFVLSSGRYMNYNDRNVWGFVYPNDSVLFEDQHDWFVQKATASQARNKVVIFASPFLSTSKAMYADDDAGNIEVFNEFDDWDFAAYGIKLIINGHSGASFHAVRSEMHVVNCSAFSRSRFGLSFQNEPGTLIGDPGWILQYQSSAPLVDNEVAGIDYPDQGNPTESYVVSRNEIVRLITSKEGIKVQFISYDTTNGQFSEALDSVVVRHEFTILA